MIRNSITSYTVNHQYNVPTVLVTDAKVIYYIGTAIRSNGDLLLLLYSVRNLRTIEA